MTSNVISHAIQLLVIQLLCNTGFWSYF